MESLPDELWLLIFTYLKKFDLIYAFANLNQRFQRIIEPYFYDIDLTQANISYRQFCHLRTRHIINQIRSLTLSSTDHLNLVYPYAQNLINLNKFTPLDYDRESDKGEEDSDEDDEEKPLEDVNLLAKILLLPSLTELSICNDKPSVRLLQTIADLSTPNLTILSFTKRQGLSVASRKMYAKTYLPTDLSLMPNVKCLTVGLISNETLHQIFETMPNLEELTFSMLEFTPDDEEEDVELDVPVTLKKLQIEGRCSWDKPSFESVKKLVEAFDKGQIHSLTLIIDNAPYEFANYEELHSFTLNSIRLENFSYYIHTESEPDTRFPNVKELYDSTYSGSRQISYSFYTWPKPVPRLIDVRPLTELIQYNSYKQVITSEQLLNCKSFAVAIEYSSDKVFPKELDSMDDNEWGKIVNLKRIKLRCNSEYLDELLEIRTYSIVKKLVAQSPNINSIRFLSDNTQTIIFYLKNLPFQKLSTKITDFYVDESHSVGKDDQVSYLPKFYATFFDDLSEIFPCIERLTVPVSDEQFAIDNLSSFLEKLKKLFHSLTHLKLLILSSSKTAVVVLETLNKQLDEIIQNDKNSLYYTETDIEFIGKQFNIWL